MIVIVLLIVAVLLLFAVREGFAATATIKNPNSWNAEEYTRIKALVPGSAFTDAEILDVVGGMWSVWSDATRPITTGQLISYMDRKPEYAPRKAAFVNLLKAYYIDQFDYQFAGGHSEVVTTPATTPATPPVTPPGGSSGDSTIPSTPPVTPPSGSSGDSTIPSTPPVTPAVDSAGASVDSTAADVGTTGGSSSSLGPTNIPAGTKGARVIYGPEWRGLGEGGTPDGDSTGTRSYPVLLGPEPVASTRIDGVGVVAPSQNYLLGISGMLPSADSLGAGELSRFLPFSRPTAPNAGIDPWRVASAFSTASYSQKTDPVPFLADFSAFQR